MSASDAMSPLVSRDFALGEITAERVLDALAIEHHCEPPEHASVIYHDTFDWRLWRADSQLIEERRLDRRELAWRSLDGELRQLWLLDDDETLGLLDTDARQDIRQSLGNVVSMRRVMPILRIDHHSHVIRVLDDERKTVVRLRVIEPSAASPTLAPERPPRTLERRLRIEPVRGYDKALERVERKITRRLGLEPCATSLLAAGVAALGRQPGDYNSKVRLQLAPASSALDAARHIHLQLLSTMKANLDGVRRDLDSEFLHDFRVAVRRTRSALGQIKGVFGDAAVADFKARFSWLGKVTGPTRDLDVYILKLPDYRADLPADAAGDLAPLGAFLVERQREEQQKLARALGSDTFTTLLADWRAFLAEPTPGHKAEDPVVEVASARIWKNYRKIVKHASKIDASTPAEHIHEVRIMAKKLRYLMEFFRSLYPTSRIDTSIRELKRLQSTLGDFNDYEVQQDALGDLAEQMKHRGLATAPTLLAMGRLQARLADGQAAEREKLDERFERFLSDANQRRFAALFA